MKRHTGLLAAILTATFIAPSAMAEPEQEQSIFPNDTLYVPVRAVVVSGDRAKARDLVALLYDRSEQHHSEPGAPRFLFLDREGKVAFGIGGYLKGTVSYDFDGAIDDGPDFTTYEIPAPFDPGQRNRLYGNANQSSILLQLVGRSDRFGIYQMYIQTNFSGNGSSGYGLKLKQAYVKVGNLTVGLANSTFVDVNAATPVIDDEGPSGEMSRKNVLVRWTPKFGKGFSAGIGAEMPSVTYTTNATVKKISQRFPDIPGYIQYQWNGGKSHVRASGLLRELSYRDLATGRNHFKTGWAAQLSGMLNFLNDFTFFYQGAYGQGYGTYVNDLGGNGFDLVYTDDAGKMEAPRMANFEVGLRYNFSNKFHMAGSYSQARTFGARDLGEDTYRYSQYVSVSGFLSLFDDVTVGLEYLHGTRTDYSGTSGHANRIEAMLKYSF